MFSCTKTIGAVVRFSIKSKSSVSKRFYVWRNWGAATIMDDKFKLPERYGSGDRSVWVEYIQLAAEVNPIVNLGQGFPDYAVPEHVTRNLADVATGPDVLLNQYTRGYGHPRLVNALSKLYSKLLNRTINPNNEILVSAGAYEALYCAIMGHVDEGDEVIVIEPFFDCYEPMIKAAGGIPRFIPLKPTKSEGEVRSSDWELDFEELKLMFNNRTKIIIINTPHNPLGKVFVREELDKIAELCKAFNVMVIADEVYEWMVYAPMQHIRIATLSGMWDRTITIGSAGKTFSVTGWKTGWAYGPVSLMKNLFVVHQNCLYTHNTAIQEAIARAFEFEMARMDSNECYFYSLARELRSKRRLLVQDLEAAGFVPTIPDAGYFIVANWSNLEDKLDLSNERDKFKDYRFTKYLTKNVGVLAIPPSAFYSDENKYLGEDYVRFCFIKKDENLKTAGNLLKAWSKQL